MIPVRLPADLQVVLASERRFFLDRDHATYEMVCPVCDQTCGNDQGRACVLVFVGINSRNREEDPQGRYTTGAGILVHADCAGVPEVAPPKNESNLPPTPGLTGVQEGVTRSGDDVSVALPTVGTAPSSPTMDESQDPTPDPEAVQEPMDREGAARIRRALLDIRIRRILLDILDNDERLRQAGDAPVGPVTPTDWFDQFRDMPHDARMDTHGQWCWRHWAPCPVLGGNGLGASTEIMQIWLEELAVTYIGSPPPYTPDELNDGMEATGKICCALGDERMFALWGNWPPTSTLVAGPYAPLAEPTPTALPSADPCCPAYPDCAEPHPGPLVEEHGEPVDAPEDPNGEG